MSAHYSKYDLNTYAVTPYFHTNVPADYPLHRVLQKTRAFRRLPPRLRELAGLAKKWACRVWKFPAGIGGIENYYSADGYELEPGTKRRLTDREIDAQWIQPDAELASLVVKDIPLPPGGFPDPDTWEEPPEEKEVEIVDRGLTEDGVLGDIASHGRKRTAEEYGIPAEQLARVKSDQDLAQMILGMEGKPWPKEP